MSPVKRIAHFENDIELLPSLSLTARNRAATRANLPRTKGKRKDASCDLYAVSQVANASADVTSKGAVRFGRICRFLIAVRKHGGWRVAESAETPVHPVLMCYRVFEGVPRDGRSLDPGLCIDVLRKRMLRFGNAKIPNCHLRRARSVRGF